MKYVGIETQQRSNNLKSVLLLLLFPALLFGLLYAACSIMAYTEDGLAVEQANYMFIGIFPWTGLAVFLWFLIAYFTNVKIIDYVTGAHTLQRSENKRVYNLVENLCISCGMQMPKIHVIEDGALNAFASGVSRKSYTVTLTRGIIDKLDDKELEAVIAHELTHIRNNDVRVLIISIVFVGIFALLSEISLRLFLHSSMFSGRRNGKNDSGALVMMIAVFVLAAVGYAVSVLIRLAISRKREYMADAGAAALTKDPLSLASALRKISGKSSLLKKQDDLVAQLFIEHAISDKNPLTALYATHPPIEKRIKILEQF